MTQFFNGPAAGRVLMLQRSPLYLRVTHDGKTHKIDALDQLVDEPAVDELICVYRLESRDGGGFIDWTEKGKRRGAYIPSATYVLATEQPDDATARDTAKWRAWCLDQQAKAKAKGTS